MNAIPKKAVVLARGLGRRMRADADGVSLSVEQETAADSGIKALIPVAKGKTVLELIVANVSAAGFDEICLVIGPEHALIREFCASRDIRCDFAIQEEPLGTADAVLAAEEFAGEDLFLVVNSDNIYPVEGLRRLREHGSPASLAFERSSLIEHSNISPERIASFATVEIDIAGNLREIVEKPETVEPDSFVSMNAWLFSPAIFEACRSIGASERGEYEITSAVQFAIDKLGVEFSAIKSYEGVIDLSNRGDIETASRFLSREQQ